MSQEHIGAARPLSAEEVRGLEWLEAHETDLDVLERNFVVNLRMHLSQGLSIVGFDRRKTLNVLLTAKGAPGSIALSALAPPSCATMPSRHEYRVRPGRVQAFQFAADRHPWPPPVGLHRDQAGVDTPFGWVPLRHGDWVVIDCFGRPHVWPDALFRAVYEPIEEPTPGAMSHAMASDREEDSGGGQDLGDLAAGREVSPLVPVEECRR